MGEKYENINRPRKEIFFNNLLGGFAWGIGATLGLAILIALLGFVGHHIDFVPIIGNFVSQIIDFVIAKHPQLGSAYNMPFLFTQYVYA